ncbi:MAG: hypothetical protein K0Q70_726 [Rhodospirillales bacterium]|jgi:hypothetical protein|nr:hypothetical protein [Rhodospirillales bacterium]
MERRALQVVIVCASLVPILAGLAGMAAGAGFIGGGTVSSTGIDSHFHYLSGLLLGIGLGFVSTVPRIEHHGQRFLLLAGIVFVGGLGRLVSLVVSGAPPAAMRAALVMELLVTPALALWQRRIARRAASRQVM